MATAAIAARAGVLALSSGATVSSTDSLVEIVNIRLRVNQDDIDATSNDSSGWNEFVLGQKGWTGTAETLYTASSSNPARIMADAILNAYAVSLRMFPSTAASATHNYNGTAHITDFELGGDTAGLHRYSLSFQGTGALTYSTST